MNTEPQVFHPKGLKAVLGDARGRRETKGGGEAAPAPLSPAARGRVPRGESSRDAGGGGRDEPPSARSPPPPRSESIRGRPRRRRALKQKSSQCNSLPSKLTQGQQMKVKSSLISEIVELELNFPKAVRL